MMHFSGPGVMSSADSTRPHGGFVPPAHLFSCDHVQLCDPDPRRRRYLAGELQESGLVVSELTDLDGLQHWCQQCKGGVIALPLEWSSTGKSSSPPTSVDPNLLAFLRGHGRQREIIVYADTHRIPMGIYCQTLAAGARRVLDESSPSFLADLAETLSRLCNDQRARAEEQRHLDDTFATFGLIGRSAILHEVFQRSQKASHFSDLPVLLLGETGTGKQRLAEAIHRLDPKRRDKPFVTVNCAAISKTLAESELFGHVKGAFSGAGGDRAGLFRSAQGGTLLLDEIGELDQELQPKLLRVLQERQLLPVGEDYEHAIDIRVIAATNRPLQDMVAAGKFREDLYQRLNVFRIMIPPLRERPEDIEEQARHFLRLWSAEHGISIDFGPRVLEALRLLPWEGNTRQLRNFLWETLAHKANGGLIGMEDLPHWVLEKLATPAPRVEDVVPSSLPAPEMLDTDLSLSQALEEYERLLLIKTLEETSGNRTQAGRRLGLTPRSIFNKIKKYGLE